MTEDKPDRSQEMSRKQLLRGGVMTYNQSLRGEPLRCIYCKAFAKFLPRYKYTIYEAQENGHCIDIKQTLKWKEHAPFCELHCGKTPVTAIDFSAEIEEDWKHALRENLRRAQNRYNVLWYADYELLIVFIYDGRGKLMEDHFYRSTGECSTKELHGKMAELIVKDYFHRHDDESYDVYECDYLEQIYHNFYVRDGGDLYATRDVTEESSIKVFTKQDHARGRW